MNKRQERAISIIVDTIHECVDAFKMVMHDYPTYSDEYEYAKDVLSHHDELVDYVYGFMLNEYNDFPSDLRFCGKSWLRSQIGFYAKSIGY